VCRYPQESLGKEPSEEAVRLATAKAQLLPKILKHAPDDKNALILQVRRRAFLAFCLAVSWICSRTRRAGVCARCTPPSSVAVASFLAAVLTEIYLCGIFS
jgi:hypothetical protein